MSIVHIVGTGTIAEPLIGLLADHREQFGLDEVTFHKRTPLETDRPKVRDLERRGAILSTDADRRTQFESLGHAPKYEAVEPIERADVVIDCTPVGLAMKRDFYESAQNPWGFMAQGSEFGFGKMYARGVNDEALVPGDDRFLHVVSCNTHNIAVIVETLAMDADGSNRLENGTFVCVRRSSDISQSSGFVASPIVDPHPEDRFGTHHARDTTACSQPWDTTSMCSRLL